MTCYLEKKQYTFICTTVQMCVLLGFNGTEGEPEKALAYEDIEALVGKEAELVG